jgi:hypothetical protein
MRLSLLPIALPFLLFLGGGAYAQNRYYLPHIATGHDGRITYRTSFILFNTTDSDASVSIKLTDDNGNPLAVTIAGIGSNSQFDFAVPAGGSRVFQTDGGGNLISGGAVVVSTTPIGVSGTFTVYDADGSFVTECGVGTSDLVTEFVLPVDTTDPFNTGLALLNAGAADASVTLTLRDTNGNAGPTASLTLRKNGHRAGFVSGADQLFRSAMSFRGTLWVRSSTPIAAMTLRMNQNPLCFTSMPVVPATSTAQSLNLAQVASGAFATGGFKTSFLILNMSATQANVRIVLTKDDGSQFVVTIPGYGTSDAFDVRVPGNGAVFLQTVGSGPLAWGAASISSNVPIGASSVFTVLDSAGNFQTEAGVGDSPVLTSLTLPVDTTGHSDTGIALSNPGASDVALIFRLLDVRGTVVSPVVARSLPAHGHLAEFITGIFPGSTGFTGSVTISATSTVAALTLRQYQTASPPMLSYTTLPVGSGAPTGKATISRLLRSSRAGIGAADNVTADVVLQTGLKISGTISGGADPAGIAAIGQSGAVFSGTVDEVTRRYLIAVPQGTYRLQVWAYPVDPSSTFSLAVLYSDPDPVTVSDDVDHNIALPAYQLFSVSGRVTGLDGLPSSVNPSIAFSSGNTVKGRFSLASDGTYQGVIPTGDYVVSIAMPSLAFSSYQKEDLNLYNVGAARVSGDTALAPYAIPATAVLSGTVDGAGLPAPMFGATVIAADNSAQVLPDVGPISLAAPASSVAAVDPTSNHYQMILPRNRGAQLMAVIPVGNRDVAMLYPTTPILVDMSRGDSTHDFLVPALSGQVNLSGRVTDVTGRGLSGITVTASSDSITGAGGLGYSAAAKTDLNGNYTMILLVGSDYAVTFTPGAAKP